MNELTPKIRHHAWRLQICAFVAAGAVLVLQSGAGVDVRMNAVVVVCGGVYLASTLLNGSHGAALCSYCFAEFPLDAQAAAARHRRAFRVHHLARAGLAFPLVASQCVFAVSAHLGLPGADRAGGVSLGILMWAAALWLLATRRHDRLQVWCPWCGGDDDDDGGDGGGEAGPGGPAHGLSVRVPSTH